MELANILSWYLLLGVVWSIVYNLIHDWLVNKELIPTMDELGWTWREAVVLILLWPICLAIFLYAYFNKTLK